MSNSTKRDNPLYKVAELSEALDEVIQENTYFEMPLDTKLGDLGDFILKSGPVNVEMLFGHGPNVFREVEMSEKFWQKDNKTVEDVLDQVFHQGQNVVVQSKDRCSVSVGDVIHLFSCFFLVESIGFRQIGFKEYMKLRDDSFSQQLNSL